jgi:RNA recognition motif-containing protein
MTKLFVGNLPFEVTPADLRAAFAAYGDVSSADIVTDSGTGRSRGFAFVEMPSKTQATAAIQGLNDRDLKGRNINVALAQTPREGGGRAQGPRGWAVVGTGRDRW